MYIYYYIYIIYIYTYIYVYIYIFVIFFSFFCGCLLCLADIEAELADILHEVGLLGQHAPPGKRQERVQARAQSSVSH